MSQLLVTRPRLTVLILGPQAPLKRGYRGLQSTVKRTRYNKPLLPLELFLEVRCCTQPGPSVAKLVACLVGGKHTGNMWEKNLGTVF